MALKLIYEALEIEKLLEEEKAAREKGPIAEKALEDKKVEDAVEQQKEEEGEGTDPSMDPETEGATQEEDPSTASPEAEGGDTPENGEVKAEDTPKEKGEEKPVQESLREIGRYDLSLESFGEGALSVAGTAASKGVGMLVSAISSSLSTLGDLTATHGPKLLKALYKGVIYTLAKVVEGLDKTYTAIDKTVERRKNSVNSLKTRLSTLKETIKTIESSDTPVEDLAVTYGNREIIDSLKCGESVDFIKNLSGLDKFLVSTVGRLHKSVLNDISGLQRLTTLYATRSHFDVAELMRVDVSGLGLVKGVVEGEEGAEGYVDPYKSTTPLPGDAVMVAHLPMSSLRNLEEYESAYRESSLFIGFNKSGYHQVNDVKLKGFGLVKDLVSVLETLVKNYEAQQTLYEDIRNTKPGVMLSIKKHAMRLVESNTKIRYSDSLVGPLYAKSSFIAKVYLAGSLDIHDYAAKTISNGLSLAEELAKKYG